MAWTDRLPPRVRTVYDIVEEAVVQWSEDNIPLRAAAISYYFLITMAPLALIFLYVLTRLVGAVEPQDLVSGADVITPGSQAASQVVGIARSYADQVGTAGPLVAGGLALLGGTVLLAQFTSALDVVWKSEPEEGGWRYVLRTRLLAIAGLFTIMIALLAAGAVGTMLSVGLDAIRAQLSLNIELPPVVETLLSVSWLVALGLVTLLLSFAFTWLPRRRIRWRDTLPGSLITAGAYMVGQRALGGYLSGSAVVSAFGATGTIIALVIWIYYTMQVVLFGAALTRVLVLRFERRREGHSGPQAEVSS